MVADALGNTPMHYAALADTPEVMGFFLQQTKGFLTPDVKLVDSRNELGETPLLKAATAGVIPVLRALIDEGSDLFAYDNSLNTLFIILIKHGHLWCFNFMYSYMRTKFGSKRASEHLMATDKDNHNVLDWAAHVGDCNLVEYLLRQEVDLHRFDDQRRSALFWAVKAGSTRAVRFLILCGSDPHDADEEGISPYMVAKSRRDHELMRTMRHFRALHNQQLSQLSRQGSGGFSNSMVYSSYSTGSFEPEIAPGSSASGRSRGNSGGASLPRPDSALQPTPTNSNSRVSVVESGSPGIQMDALGSTIAIEEIQLPNARLARTPSPMVLSKNLSNSSVSSVSKTNSNGSTASVSDLGGVYSGMSPQQLAQVQQLQAQALTSVHNRDQLSTSSLGEGQVSGKRPTVGGSYSDRPRASSAPGQQSTAEKIPPLLYNLSYDYGRLTNFLYRHLLCCHCLCAHTGGCEELNQLSSDSQLLSHVDEQSEQSSVVTTNGVLIKRSNAIHSTLTSRSGYIFGFFFVVFVMVACSIWVPWYVWLLGLAVCALFHHKVSTMFPETFSQEKASKQSHHSHSRSHSHSSHSRTELQFNYAALVAGYRRGYAEDNSETPLSTVLLMNWLDFCKAVATAPEKHMGSWMGAIAAYCLYIALNIAQYFAPDTVARHFNNVAAISAVSNHPTMFALVCIFTVLTVYFWLWIVYLAADPGIIDTRCEDFDEVMQHSYRLHAPPPGTLYCRTSLVKKPLRSKYCAQSGFVIARMDHFCVWLNCSIGYTNHITFMNFLFSHALASMLTVVLIAREIHSGISDGDGDNSSACHVTGEVLSSVYFFPLLLCAFATFVAFGLCMLTFEQCWNIAHNVVSYRFIGCFIDISMPFYCCFYTSYVIDVFFRPRMKDSMARAIHG